nr:hypothetical protein [Ramlibacter albus]
MGYFALGSLPLLILKHDTPMDARFIRGFFHLYYRAVLFAAVTTSVAYAFAGQPGFCAGMAVLALVVFTASRIVLPGMDALRNTMTPEDAGAIARFRRLHGYGMALNALQVVTVGWSMTLLRL